MPIISVIILTYNSKKHIKDFLESLKEHTNEKIRNGDYEIVIVDNNSSDGTYEYLDELTQDLFPQLVGDKDSKKPIKLIQSKENRGYAAGINYGVKFATGKYILVINPDAEILDGNFGGLRDEFLKDDKIAIVGGRMMKSDGFIEQSAGNFYTPLRLFMFLLGRDDKSKNRFAPSRAQEVDYVSGGFVMIKHEIFKKLSGYDEGYFMYIEDMDLCYRARKAGYKVLYSPVAKIKHYGQGSSNRSFAIIHIFKGLNYFYSHNAGFFMKIYVKSILVLKALSAIFVGMVTLNRKLVMTYTKALQW